MLGSANAMEQPSHDLRPFQAPAASPRRFVSIGAVILLHLILIYALASGLAANMAQKVIQDVQVAVVQEKPPQQKLPPPPPPPLVKPPPPEFVPPPEINIQSEAAPTNTITQVTNTPAPPAPPAPAVVAPTLAASANNNCAAKYYPAMAVRLSHQGSTMVTVHIGADGSVASADVTGGSGYDELDQAAITCIQNGWHFKPAEQNGSPVASTKQYRIVWKLAG
jgi:protein TonB